jgi:hypothetical protein
MFFSEGYFDDDNEKWLFCQLPFLLLVNIAVNITQGDGVISLIDETSSFLLNRAKY